MTPAIVVVGSLHYDILVDAPDRPRKGETLLGRSWTPTCGGKGGNQAVAARRQGAATAMIGAVGDDIFGAALLTGLDAAQVDRLGVVVLAGAGSGMSVAIVDDAGEYGAVIVSGANLAIRAEQIGNLREAKIMLLQNEIPERINLSAAQRAADLGAITILNAAPARRFETALPDLVDVLVVNAVEAEMLGAGVVDSLESAASAARRLLERFRAVVVTAGSDGVAFADRGGERIELAGVTVVVVSTHGAGDRFVGTLAARLAAGDTMRPALDAANREAARWVSTPADQRR